MLELADVDYGSSGAFTINAWFRHDQENFENYETGDPPMEQFFGHGDPAKSMPTTNQLHLVFKERGNIRTLLSDGSEPEQEHACDYCTNLGLGYYDIDPATGLPCFRNLECWGPFPTFADTNPSEHGAIDNGHMWHMLTLTTIPGDCTRDDDDAGLSSVAGSQGINTCAQAVFLCSDATFGSVITSYCPRTCGMCKKGYSVYVDGQLRAGMPYSGAGWDTMSFRMRGGIVLPSDMGPCD